MRNSRNRQNFAALFAIVVVATLAGTPSVMMSLRGETSHVRAPTDDSVLTPAIPRARPVDGAHAPAHLPSA